MHIIKLFSIIFNAFKKVSRFVKKNPQFVESFFSLSVLNGLNYLLPLVSLPYILRVIGPENFGIYSFVLVIIQYLILFSNYGFNFSGIIYVSEHRENIDDLTHNVSAILFIRLLLTFLGISLLLSLVFLIPDLEQEKMSYLFALGIVIGDVFIPVWFFRGMEKMRYITVVNFGSKGLFTILIFFFIREPQDYPLILLLNSFGYVFAAVLSMIIIRYRFGIKLIIPKYADVRFQLVNGWHLFISTIGLYSYRNANIFILGLLTSNYIVGIYASAEKITKALQSLISPVSEALFPFLSRKFSFQSKEESYDNLLNISKIYFLGLLILTLTVLSTSRILVEIIFGNQYIDSISSLRILSFVILFGGMNYLLGIIGLVNLGHKKAFTRFILISGGVNIFITVLTVPYFTYLGASFGLLMSEITLFILCGYKLMILMKKREIIS